MLTNLCVGLMSGTSLDGIDGIILDSSDIPTIIASHYQPYSADLELELKQLIESPQISLATLSTLNVRLSQEYSQAISRLLKKSGINPGQISAIGCHGQTVFHQPTSDFKYSMQLGSGAHLAEFTGIPVITDFRNNDMALGGQGAPLVCGFHRAICGQKRKQLFINLGGIANVTWIDEQGSVIGFDTGPANALLDSWYQRHHKESGFDQDGIWAASGEPDSQLVSQLLEEPYFHQPAPKSTGKEHFNLAWLDKILKKFSSSPGAAHVQASLLQLTVQSIAIQINSLDVSDIYLCGGGRNNRFLMSELQNALGMPLKSTSQLGIDPDFMEAAAFAWLAQQRLNNKTGSLASVTGASLNAVSGAVYQPSCLHSPDDN